MLIGAYAIGSNEGYIYVRHEYPQAIRKINKAIEQCRQFGLLGKDIFKSGFDFDIEVHRGAGAFVCGESTALMASLEGRVGEPRAKYIHTVEHGLWNRPSTLNNVETWSNVPPIIARGIDWFTQYGTGDVTNNPWGGSKGTKVFSMVGNVVNTGLVEIPMGMSLKELIFEIGGGIPNGKTFKGVQTGGPSGGVVVIPTEKLDVHVDFDRLAEAGSMMGSGGMIVMDENTCMVDVAKYFMDFLMGESCGKCVPCREGLRNSHTILNRITEGNGRKGDLELLEEVGTWMIDAALCGLGKSAPNPYLSTIRYFREEYEAHIEKKKCPAGVCKNLISYTIIPEKCPGCLLCKKDCPELAISGEKKKPHVIDQEKCTKCGTCVDVCRFDAVMIE
jgi:NADH:ubiquinone oxidoreductase subunit F (NADH-binding)/ferredoxin